VVRYFANLGRIAPHSAVGAAGTPHRESLTIDDDFGGALLVDLFQLVKPLADLVEFWRDHHLHLCDGIS
jgi:hypothetical protein